MIRTVDLNASIVQYEYIEMKRKSILLHFENGKVVVKAPYRTKSSIVEDFLMKHQKRIIQYINTYHPHIDSVNHTVMIFGKQYQYRIIDMKKYICKLHDDTLYVYHSNDIECIQRYLKQLLLEYCQSKIENYFKDDFLDLKYPDIVIRRFKGIWGNCHYKENKISINFTLIHLDPFLIDYVILHELCHFYEPNHSKAFYHELSKRMPDYKQRIKILGEQYL